MRPDHASWRLTAVLLVAVSPLLSGCNSPATATQAEPKPPPVTSAEGEVHIQEASRRFIVAEKVGSEIDDTTLTAPAHVEFREGAESKIGAPLNGRVREVTARTGDHIKAGSPLVILDCPEAAALRSAVDGVQASLREARLALDRERRMAELGIGIDREEVAAEARVAEQESDYARSQAGAAFVGEGAGGTVVLRSPIEGIVVGLTATVGMTVQQGGESLVDVGDPSTLWIVADVFERDVPLMQEGSAARVELSSIHETLEGRVDSVGAVVATGLRTAAVRITLSSAAHLLRPGMYGRAEITIPAHAGISLPTEAVLVKGKETVVYVQRDPTTFVRRPVVVAPPIGGRVQVVSGLQPGEQVVTQGALLLDGAADQLL